MSQHWAEHEDFTKMTMGELLTHAREQAAMSISAMSRISGFARRQIYEYERDVQVNPGLRTLSRFARAYGIPKEVLVLAALKNGPVRSKPMPRTRRRA